MTTIMPQSELARKAIAWICEMKESHEDKGINALIEEACVRFNLGPSDEEFLLRFFKENPV